jgi:hypothetical protein
MNPVGVKEYTGEDINIVVNDESLNTYDFSGIIDNPPSELDWDVLARSFELQVE